MYIYIYISVSILGYSAATKKNYYNYNCCWHLIYFTK